jgi:hypothetical protein
MKKSDIKDGMLFLIQYYDRKPVWNILINNRLYELNNKFCYSEFDEFDEDLNFVHGDENNGKILKIATCGDTLTFILRDAIEGKDIEYSGDFELLWERKEPLSINIKAEIENVEEIKAIITDLEDRLSNLKVRLSL